MHARLLDHDLAFLILRAFLQTGHDGGLEVLVARIPNHLEEGWALAITIGEEEIHGLERQLGCFGLL